MAKSSKLSGRGRGRGRGQDQAARGRRAGRQEEEPEGREQRRKQRREERREERREDREEGEEREGREREMRVSAGTHTCPLFASAARAAQGAQAVQAAIRKQEVTGKFSSIRRVEDAKNSSRKQKATGAGGARTPV